MPGRDLLERFRPSAAPGAVSRVGVPSDLPEDVEALAVLAALEPVLAQTETIRQEAHSAVRALEEQTARSVQEIQARARLDAAEARAEAAARVQAAGQRESDRLLSEASEHATELLARAEQGLPGAVDLLVATVRDAARPQAPAVPAGPS